MIHRVTIRHHTFMRIFINPRQASHHPRDEIFRGNRVPCFETPSRAMFVEQALRARGQLAMTGGFSDRSGGAYVLENVASLADAQSIAATDPLATTGSSDLTVHEWNTRAWSAI